MFTGTSLVTVLMGATCLAQSIFWYQDKLEKTLTKQFKYKRLFWWASVAFTLTAIMLGFVQLVFSTRYADPTLADYFLLVLVIILGFVAIFLSDWLSKRAVKRHLEEVRKQIQLHHS